MPTTPFANEGPVPSHTTGQALAAIKANAQIIRNMAAIVGLQGFNSTHSGGTSQEFTTIASYDNTTTGENIEVDTTYITGTGGNKIPSKLTIYHPTAILGTNVDIITYSYNADDIVIGATWSTS